jgi:hypothetical protein
MPGGLLQLVGKGAQDELMTGNPSFTHFKTVYKRHTEFAMEHMRLDMRTTSLDLPSQGFKSMRVKVDRNAQLVHDCYIHVTIPDIFSPVAPITQGIHPEVNSSAQAIGYEFQWIPNLGYNMINSVSVLINGTAVVTHTGEWMKLYSYSLHDSNKRDIVDKMIGHTKEFIDPANAYDRLNQYPHAISTLSQVAGPSIPGRDLVIPLHFWFCEDVGSSLPLVALQYSEVEFVIEFKNMYQLFTVLDVRDSNPKGTFGTRIAPDLASPEFSMDHFLSPPTVNASPVNTTLKTWALNPYIEANYIFLGDAEVVHLAKSDNAYKIKELRNVKADRVHGAGNDVEITMVNLCTRLIWGGQRSDAVQNNQWDNYTNWLDNKKAPLITAVNTPFPATPWYSSPVAVGQNVTDNDILVDATLMLDGAEREQTKTRDFYSLLQNYKHHTGKTVTALPGMYTYSFALDHHTTQPSGHLNGSQFNKTVLRLTTQEPPFTDAVISTQQCVFKNSALNNRPVGVINPALVNPDQVVTIINKPVIEVYEYTYSIQVYIESYNFLRITRGIANVVFSS